MELSEYYGFVSSRHRRRSWTSAVNKAIRLVYRYYIKPPSANRAHICSTVVAACAGGWPGYTRGAPDIPLAGTPARCPRKGRAGTPARPSSPTLGGERGGQVFQHGLSVVTALACQPTGCMGAEMWRREFHEKGCFNSYTQGQNKPNTLSGNVNIPRQTQWNS